MTEPQTSICLYDFIPVLTESAVSRNKNLLFNLVEYVIRFSPRHLIRLVSHTEGQKPITTMLAHPLPMIPSRYEWQSTSRPRSSGSREEFFQMLDFTGTSSTPDERADLKHRTLPGGKLWPKANPSSFKTGGSKLNRTLTKDLYNQEVPATGRSILYLKVAPGALLKKKISSPKQNHQHIFTLLFLLSSIITSYGARTKAI